MSAKQASQGIYNRHEEIRLALRYFLQSFYKNQRAGIAPDRQRVLFDFARYKGLRPVVERLSTRAPKVQRDRE